MCWPTIRRRLPCCPARATSWACKTPTARRPPLSIQVDTQVFDHHHQPSPCQRHPYTNIITARAPILFLLSCRPTPSSPPSKSSTRPTNWTSMPGTPCPCPATPRSITQPPMRDQRRSHRRRSTFGSTNSSPVPLTPGTWYLAVYNANTNNADHLPGGRQLHHQRRHHHHPAGRFALPTSGTTAPGPDLTNFYSFHVANPAAAARAVCGQQHERQRGFDRAQRGLCPRPSK